MSFYKAKTLLLRRNVPLSEGQMPLSEPKLPLGEAQLAHLCSFVRHNCLFVRHKRIFDGKVTLRTYLSRNLNLRTSEAHFIKNLRCEAPPQLVTAWRTLNWDG